MVVVDDGITSTEMAKILGISLTTLWRIESINKTNWKDYFHTKMPEKVNEKYKKTDIDKIKEFIKNIKGVDKKLYVYVQERIKIEKASLLEEVDKNIYEKL